MTPLYHEHGHVHMVARSIGRLAGAWDGIPAICIGNGESRLGLDLDRLPERGRAFVIGCNGLHRTFGHRLDALVALDEEISYEAMAEAEINGPIIMRGGVLRTKGREYMRPGVWAIGLPFEVVNNITAAAGVMSVAVAMAAGCSPIYTIGHDLEPGSSVYRGTDNYDKGSREPGEYKIGCWLNALRSFVHEYCGHILQVETERFPGAQQISWDDLLDRFASERVEVAK